MKNLKTAILTICTGIMLTSPTYALSHDQEKALHAGDIAASVCKGNFNDLRGIISNALDQNMSIGQVGSVLQAASVCSDMTQVLTAYEVLDTVATERRVRGKQDVYATSDSQAFDKKCTASLQTYVQESALNAYSPSFAQNYSAILSQALCTKNAELSVIAAVTSLCIKGNEGPLLDLLLQRAEEQGFDTEFFKELAVHLEKYAGPEATAYLKSRL